MKELFLAAAVLTATTPAWAAAPSYVNYGTVTVPPVVDATNFVNYGAFSFSTFTLYDFSNVRNFTNRNLMVNGSLFGLGDLGGLGFAFFGGSGFRFDTAPASTGSRYMAANFFNAPLANNPATNASIYGDYQVLVSATNIVNKGRIAVSEFGLIKLEGKNLDLSRGILQVGALSTRDQLNPEAVFDQYWGEGDTRNTPAASITESFQATPGAQVTFFLGNSFSPYFPGASALAFFGDADPFGTVTSAMWEQYQGTNGTVQIVFVRNANTNEITTEILNTGSTPFRMGDIAVSWGAVGTNVFGEIITNRIHLVDELGANPTNTGLIANFPFASPPPASFPIEPRTFQPTNFSVLRGDQFFLGTTNGAVPFTDPADPVAFWGEGAITNQYSAYGVRLATTTLGRTSITNNRNGPGRIEVVADRVLDLNFTRLDGLNYLKIQGTNHFKGASNASLSATYADIALGSTNGMLNTTGLLNPVIPRISGTIDAHSLVWTNDVAVGGQTNRIRFHVLLVDSALQGFAQPQLFDLSLRSTNVVIGDNFQVNGSLNLAAANLTLTTNAVLSILDPTINWVDSAAGLRSLTNRGAISVANEAHFIGRNANGTLRPYQNFVNEGSINAAFVGVNATNIVNVGSIFSSVGPVTLEAVSDIVLAEGGLLWTPYESVNLTCRNLYATNASLLLGRSLNLWVTDSLNVGPNSWAVYDGFNLLTKPATGDLLQVTINDNVFSYAEVFHQWAGQDRGATPAGFSNNAALGELVLDGGLFSTFTFQGTGPSSNALYVDVLNLVNSAAEQDAEGNLPALNVLPGMKIYYSQAFSNGVDVTSALAGKNGGTLGQVPHVGPLSVAARFALKASDIDLKVSVLLTPQPHTVVSWNTVAGATSHLYCVEPPKGTNWTLVTNFVSTVGGRVSITEPVSGGGGRFFKVRVDQP